MQNSDVDTAHSREIIKKETRRMQYSGAHAHMRGTKTLPPYWICATELNSHYWHTGQRSKSLLTFDWIGRLLSEAPGAASNHQWGVSSRISQGPWEEV